MDLASALLNKIIEQQDISTWVLLKKSYFPNEYHSTYDRLNSFYKRFNKIPTFEEIKFDTRDNKQLQKLSAIEKATTDTTADYLLIFLKNEYAQKLAFSSMEKLVENSVGFDTAEDTIESLQSIILDIESKVDLEDTTEPMNRINLFEPDDLLGRKVPLGLNAQFDITNKFSPGDLVLAGGKRGSGKSITCSNIVANEYREEISSLYFTVEMGKRQVLQRITATATGIPYSRIKNKNLGVEEWLKLAEWWSTRYQGGEELFKAKYSFKTPFEEFHKELVQLPLKEHQMEIIYDPSMTISKVQAEMERLVPILKPRIVVIDYLNVIKMSNSSQDMYDWKEQIEIAKKLKEFAQKHELVVFCPYQTDKDGEARFAKGILDSADAAFVLDSHDKDDNAITFQTVKYRDGNDEQAFTSVMDWDSLTIGPENAIISKKDEDDEDADDDIPF